jgi:hypothetical protein
MKFEDHVGHEKNHLMTKNMYCIQILISYVLTFKDICLKNGINLYYVCNTQEEYIVIYKNGIYVNIFLIVIKITIIIIKHSFYLRQ